MTYPIGVIDSGVGGLSIAKEIIKKLPNETIYYFGDTLRCPYGPRPLHEIKRFTLEMVHYLLRYPIKALVIACNTATVAALSAVQEAVSIPVIGVIHPGARAATKVTKNKRVAVIGTKTTIGSKAYVHGIAEIDQEIVVIGKATPKLVPLVESGNWDGPLARKVVEEELRELKKQSFDTLILGCTHFPLIEHVITEVLASKVQVINPAEETAIDLETTLRSNRLQALTFSSPHRFFTTGNPKRFQAMVQKWLQLEEVNVRVVDLNELR